MANILVVDDEKNVVDLLRATLEIAGHEVSDAPNGAELLRLLGVEPAKDSAPLPDLILLDIAMPVLDGYSAAVRLEEDSRTRSVPVVIVSVKGQMRENFQILTNIKGFVEKPFDPKYLMELVGRLAKKV